MTEDQKTPIKYPSLTETRSRLRSLTIQSERLSKLESLSLRLKETETQIDRLRSLFDSLFSDLTYVSDCLERKTRDSEDPEVWTETEDLINTLDNTTIDLRQSLQVFSDFMSDPEERDRLSLLFSETADHFIADMLD